MSKRGAMMAAVRQQGVAVSGLWTAGNTSTELWLDAKDAGTFELSGSKIIQWDDKSGNARHMVQGADAIRATYDASNAVAYTQPAAVLENTHRLGITESLTADTILAVIAYKTGTENTFDTYNAIYSGVNNADPDLIQGDVSTANMYNYHVAAAGSYVNGSASLSTVALPMTLSLHKYVFDTPRTGVFRPLWNPQGTYNSWAGPVCEYIVLNASADVVKLEGYISWKWGIQGDLSPGHAWESGAPTL